MVNEFRIGYNRIHMDRVPRTPAGITVTPIPKLDAVTTNGHNHTPLARIPRVDEDECVGCNLCALVCPVENCITMERVENGLPFQSWEQRVQVQ